MQRSERVAAVSRSREKVPSAERAFGRSFREVHPGAVRVNLRLILSGRRRYRQILSEKPKWNRGAFLRLRQCMHWRRLFCCPIGFVVIHHATSPIMPTDFGRNSQPLLSLCNTAMKIKVQKNISNQKCGETMFDRLRYDIRAIRERDPAARSGAEVFFLYSGLHAVMWYRIAHWFFKHRRFFIARWISQHAKKTTGIEIHPGAVIGKGLLIDHGSGVVIGETAVIGDNCTIYQGVTLGGTGKHKGKRHPTLGDNVMIGSGAKILGPFKIGDNAKVAAGAVVLEEVPENSTAVGVPARIVRKDGQKVCNDMDQVHIPDPVAQELCRLRLKLEKLEQALKQQTGAE